MEEEKEEERVADAPKGKRFGISSSVFAALMVAGGVAAWLASGYLRNMEVDKIATQLGDAFTEKTQATLPLVKTKQSTAQDANPKIIINGGVIEAERSVTVRAEIGGKVKTAFTEKEGAFVEKGTLLCGIGIDTRQANKEEAKAMMELRSLQMRSVKKLAKQGYNTQTSLAQAKANYNAAKAQLENATRALEKISITAPFDGIVEKIFLNVGDFANPGTPCARVIDMDPLVISGNVTEDEVVKMRTGVSGWAILPNGEKLEGFVRYIAHSADSKTKTYRIELEAENPNKENSIVRDGITVPIHIPLQSVLAHAIPSSILTLDEDGTIGLRVVEKTNGKNIVRFKPIKIIEGNAKEYWVTGLPMEVQLIVVGQEYVQDGTEVAIDDGVAPVAPVAPKSGNAAQQPKS